MNDELRINQILRRWEALKSERRAFESSLWEPARRFCQPQAGAMSGERGTQRGERRGAECFDGTPEWAADILVNGLQSGLTPDNYKWFKWSVAPLWLNEVPEVKSYLQKCEDIAYLALNDSNYSEATIGVYRQQAIYGTGCKYVDYDPVKMLSFRKINLTDVCFAENRQGSIDTCYREFTWSARNAVKEWGANAPEKARQAVDSGNHDQEFTFLHVVYPREDYSAARRDRSNMPFASLWIYPQEKTLLDEGGYLMFPYSTPRWDKDDDGPWGRGPAMKALQDMGVLNQMEKTNLVGAHKMVEPPISIPDGYEDPINLNPGGRNRYSGSGGRIEPIITGINLPWSVEYQDRKARAVERRFHVDVFLMLTENPRMTATEVIERKQEKLVILGPTIGRQKTEHLDSDLDIIFHLLNENGHLPPPPGILLEFGRKIRTEYISPLALAQRRIDVESTMRVYRSASAMAQLTGRPDAIDVLNDEEAIRLIADREAAPVGIIRSREEVELIRELRRREMGAVQARREDQGAASSLPGPGATMAGEDEEIASTEAGMPDGENGA